MHESWYDNELRLSILVRNENELLWSSADNVIFIYPIKFIFSCLSYSGWIGSGTNRFGFYSVRVISGSGLYRVNKSLGQFGFDSGHIRFRINSDHYSFGSVRFWVVQFWISSRNRFNSFSCRIGSLLPGLLLYLFTPIVLLVSYFSYM